MAAGRTADAKSSEAIRVFIAIELDDAARRSIAAAIRGLRAGPGGDRVRWSRPETLHVTLRFLGEIDPACVAPLAAGLRAELGDIEPFEMEFGALGAFPSLQRPQAVYFEAGPEPALAALAAAVDRGASRAGFPAEPRRFQPHLTLGRFRRGNREPVTASVTAPADVVGVDGITVFHSQITRAGAIHTPLERIALAVSFGGTNHP